MHNLLVTASLALDIVFFVILVLGLFFGVKNGFVSRICKIEGTLLSFALGILFCRKFQAFIDVTLGLKMTQALQGVLANAIPSETIANSVGEWLAIAISFLALVILVRLLAWIVGKIGTALVRKVKFFRVLDHIFGGLLGLAQAALFVFLLLAICWWIPWEPMHTFISSSSIVGKIVESTWFQTAINFPKLIVKDPNAVPPDPEAVIYFVKRLFC